MNKKKRTIMCIYHKQVDGVIRRFMRQITDREIYSEADASSLVRTAGAPEPTIHLVTFIEGIYDGKTFTPTERQVTILFTGSLYPRVDEKGFSEVFELIRERKITPEDLYTTVLSVIMEAALNDLSVPETKKH
jgi:hypothetical protein